MHKKVVLLGSQLNLISKSTLLLLGTMTFQCLGLGVLLGPEHFHRQRAHPSESPFYRWKQTQLLKKNLKSLLCMELKLTSGSFFSLGSAKRVSYSSSPPAFSYVRTDIRRENKPKPGNHSSNQFRCTMSK